MGVSVIWGAGKTPEQWCGYGSARRPVRLGPRSSPSLRSLLIFSAAFPATPTPCCLHFPTHPPIPTRATVYKSAFVPLHGAKSHLPKSHRILPHPGSNERSRSPLSIGALHVARGDRMKVFTKVASKTVSRFPAQSSHLARLVQDDGSRKLPQNILKNNKALAQTWCRILLQDSWSIVSRPRRTSTA